MEYPDPSEYTDFEKYLKDKGITPEEIEKEIPGFGSLKDRIGELQERTTMLKGIDNAEGMKKIYGGICDIGKSLALQGKSAFDSMGESQKSVSDLAGSVGKDKKNLGKMLDNQKKTFDMYAKEVARNEGIPKNCLNKDKKDLNN